jgi:endo-1,4-beta-xylanase
VITRSAGSGLVAALTFDDGPNGATTGRLLDFLRRVSIPAVFCLIGEHVLAPGGAHLVRRMADEGHVLCNHTTSHADMGDWERAEIETDLVRNGRIIRDALGDDGYPIPYFRAPNGNWGRTSEIAASLGMRSLAVTGTIDDWQTQNPQTLATNLRKAMKPGRLVLAHDGGGDREGTVDAVITVVSERLAEGWDFLLPEAD